MALRFHVDDESGEAHCRSHGVSEDEVAEVLAAPLDEFGGRDDARIALGQTEAGRYLQVVYVPTKAAAQPSWSLCFRLAP